MQTGDFLETAHAKVERSKGEPLTNIAMGKAIVEQHLGATGRHTQPGQRQLHREAPLARTHPDVRIREGAGQGTEGKLVL